MCSVATNPSSDTLEKLLPVVIESHVIFEGTEPPVALITLFSIVIFSPAVRVSCFPLSMIS